jgi:antitoxin (DNA-binding transcriptional repressor) of toxin-antitoxin stability system
MIIVSATQGVNSFHQLLAKVEHGETVKILKHGKARARIVPDCDFMTGEAIARVFNGYHATAADRSTADAVANNIRQLDQEGENALAH